MVNSVVPTARGIHGSFRPVVETRETRCHSSLFSESLRYARGALKTSTQNESIARLRLTGIMTFPVLEAVWHVV